MVILAISLSYTKSSRYIGFHVMRQKQTRNPIRNVFETWIRASIYEYANKWNRSFAHTHTHSHCLWKIENGETTWFSWYVVTENWNECTQFYTQCVWCMVYIQPQLSGKWLHTMIVPNAITYKLKFTVFLFCAIDIVCVSSFPFTTESLT